MEIQLLKLILTPLLIAGVSLAGRRWGPTVGGLLVALPLTSGPILFFFALERGTPFTVNAALGTLAGLISNAVFMLVFAWLVIARPWWIALPVALAGFLVCTFALQFMTQFVTLSLPLLLGAVWLSLILALGLLPRGSAKPSTAQAPWWDIPGRMVVATGFVLLLTGVAAALGPHLSGLLTPFPVFVSVLAIFTARVAGPAATVQLLRGVLLGLFACSLFFVVLALVLPVGGVGVTFPLAILVTLTGQALWLVLSRRHTSPAHLEK
jgi:hypothetical protein